MCIPCWPWADVYIEDPPKKKRRDRGVIYYDPVANTTMKLTGGSGIKLAPYPAYTPTQPMMYGNAASATYYGNAVYPTQPANVYGHIQQPPFNTIGLTGTEVYQQQLGMAAGMNIGKPMDMKPADDDPYLWYWVREQDGTWVQRNRITIDSGDIGKVRWYADNGSFYGVRLAD